MACSYCNTPIYIKTVQYTAPLAAPTNHSRGDETGTHQQDWRSILTVTKKILPNMWRIISRQNLKGR